MDTRIVTFADCLEAFPIIPCHSQLYGLWLDRCGRACIGQVNTIEFALEMNNQAAHFVGGYRKASATVEHFFTLCAVTLVDRASDLASFSVKLGVRRDKIDKRGSAAKSGAAGSVQPFTQLAAVIPADRIGVELFVMHGR